MCAISLVLILSLLFPAIVKHEVIHMKCVYLGQKKISVTIRCSVKHSNIKVF